MAVKSENNRFDYTNLTYPDIERKLESILDGSGKFVSSSQSAVYRVLVDDFVAMADLVNYYIERTAEESFLSTARHLSSAIVGAKQIGYVPRRPTSAKASVSFELSNPDSSWTFRAGDAFTVKGGTDSLSFDGDNFVFCGSYVYVLTEADATMLNGGGSITISSAIPEEIYGMLVVEGASEEEIAKRRTAIVVMQGDRKTVQLVPGVLAGKKFQIYRVDDPDFSNYYGSEDVYDAKAVMSGGAVTCVGNPAMMTRVFVTDGTARTEYHVNRRSLCIERWNVDAIAKAKAADVESPILPVCLVESGMDTTVSVCFGDGVATRLGPVSGEYVEIEYLATKGSAANRYGVVGKTAELDATGNFETSGSVIDFPGIVTVRLESNVTGGSGFEDVESIKTNAPAIYQSLDRLVTKTDYEAFVKTIVDPITVKYGSAWGEAEERLREGTVSVPELMNVALTTAMGGPYRKNADGNWEFLNPFDTDEAADSIFVEGTAWETFRNYAYYYVYLKKSVPEYMSYVYGDDADDAASMERVKRFLEQVSARSQLTVSNVYVPPTIHVFRIAGSISVDRYCDVADLKTRMRNAIYEYLNANANFGKPVFVSNVSSIIESFDEVRHCSIRFESTAKNPVVADLGTAGKNALYVDGTTNPEQQTAMENLVVREWQQYIQNHGGDLDSYYKVSLYTTTENGTTVGPENSKTPTYSAYTSTGTRMTNLKVAENGSGFRDWKFTDYDYNEKERALAVHSRGKGGKEGSPVVWQKTNSLVSGFSEYGFLDGYMRKLYVDIKADPATASYLDDENDFIHYFSAMRDAMERVFGYSMLDADGNVKKFSIDNEFAMVMFDDSIITQIGD